jgi:hypothetical protein
VGASEHGVAVPADREAQPVQRFGVCTADLYALAAWLRQCQIDTVVMESTRVYWIALFEVLEERGFDVKLVDPLWSAKLSLPSPFRGCEVLELPVDLVQIKGLWIKCATDPFQHLLMLGVLRML